MFSENCFGEQTVHEKWMQVALSEARQAVEKDEVLCRSGGCCCWENYWNGSQSEEQLADPTAHAEMIALTQAASSLGSWRLLNCVLYVTLEPCLMCAGAIVQARVPVVVWGAGDPKAGAVESLYNLFDDPRLNHQVQHVGHVLEQESSELLSSFFREKRQNS